MEKNITQQTLSEGICAVETYSRIETGKRIPSAKNLHALTEKLEIGWCSYRGELETDNLQAYELRQKQRTAAIEGRFEDEFCILQKMERVLDMQSAINYQYVKAKQVKVQERLGQIKAEEAYEKDMELLQKTTTLCLEERLVYYSQTEAEIIGHMAQMLRKQKKVEEGIALLERVLGNIRKNKVKIEHQWSGTEFLLRVLGGLYFEIGRYEDSNRIKRYCYKMSLRFRDGGNIPELLDAIADNFEHLGEQYRSEYEKLYRYAYYTADFFEIIDAKVFLKTYYEEHFDATMQWY